MQKVSVMMIMRVMQMVLNLIMMKMVRRRNMILLRKTAEGRIVLEIKMKSSQACEKYKRECHCEPFFGSGLVK